jgi:hypothetical protein
MMSLVIVFADVANVNVTSAGKNHAAGAAWRLLIDCYEGVGV